MPGVPSVVGRSPDHLVPESEPHADACAVVEEEEVVAFMPFARPKLGYRGGRHVLLEQHRKSRRFHERGRQRDFVPSLEQGRVEHDAALKVDGARRGDAHPEQAVAVDPRRRDDCLDGVAHACNGMIRAHGGGVCDDPPAQIHQHIGDDTGVHMHADRVSA